MKESESNTKLNIVVGWILLTYLFILTGRDFNVEWRCIQFHLFSSFWLRVSRVTTPAVKNLKLGNFLPLGVFKIGGGGGVTSYVVTSKERVQCQQKVFVLSQLEIALPLTKLEGNAGHLKMMTCYRRWQEELWWIDVVDCRFKYKTG